ncbi:MAG: M50 family metallopeptidase [Solirubrobacteraceae bacterium]
MSYLLAFAGFSALIILHELGHFVAAKAVGMRVERFALFFPPLIWRWRPKKDSETEYAIGAIPLGGYVKISGMNPEEPLPPEVAERAYYRQKVWKRIVVIGAGPAVNIVLAFLILWVLFTVRPLTFVEPAVQSVQPRTPAAQVLKPGDRILSVDGKPGFVPGTDPETAADRVDDLRTQIAEHQCAGDKPRAGCRATTPVRLVVLRDDRRLTLNVVPRYDAKQGRLLIGFSFVSRQVDYGPGQAAGYSVRTLWRITTTTVDNIVRVFYDPEARKQVSGVVGSYEATRQSFEFDTAQAAFVLAIISLSLAVINLFPFLPLDGGHIFWAIAEKIRGRPIPFRVMERAGIVGFMLVIFLAYVGLSNDIGRITSGEGFGVR